MTSTPSNSEAELLATSLPVVMAWVQTADGRGRLFKMQPGMRVVLDEPNDQWEPNHQEGFHDQLLRVSQGPRLLAHREAVRQVCVAEYSSNPLWQRRAAKDPQYWNRFYVGRHNLPPKTAG